MDKFTLRPSSLGSFLMCPWSWYNTFILGKRTIPGARAHLGTAVHKSAEVLWLDAIQSGKKDLNVSKATDAAVEEFHEICKQQPPEYGDDKPEIIENLVVHGAKSFINDIAPLVDIPIAVEKRYTVEIDNPIIEKISGSLDYVGESTIHDIKTTKKKPIVSNYSLQQGAYALLREANGEQIDSVKIQAIIMRNPTSKKDASAEGMILDMVEDNTNPFLGLSQLKEQSRYVVNNILETVKAFSEDKVAPEILFRGNPKSNLCSNKYCSLYHECKFVKGDLK